MTFAKLSYDINVSVRDDTQLTLCSSYGNKDFFYIVLESVPELYIVGKRIIHDS